MIELNQKPVIALIPARGGSKGVKGKNMRLVNGMPLVGYTFKSALDSKYISKIILSSDDDNTLAYGQDAGVTVVRRPPECSSDSASANSVVTHLISTLAKEVIAEDPYIVYLQPTSPMRTAKHIDDALETMVDQGFHKLISVIEMTKSPYKAFVLDEHGGLKALFDEGMTNQRRQDLPRVFMPNGAIYVFRISDFCRKHAFPSNGSYPYVMSEMDSLDIDNETDFEVFEKIAQK